MAPEKILLEGQEAEDLKKYLEEDKEKLQANAFLDSYGITLEDLEDSKEYQYGLLEEYRELEIAAKQKAEKNEKKEQEGDMPKDKTHQPFDWKGEVARAIAKGWLKKEDADKALALIQTNREEYDKLLTIHR